MNVVFKFTYFCYYSQVGAGLKRKKQVDHNVNQSKRRHLKTPSSSREEFDTSFDVGLVNLCMEFESKTVFCATCKVTIKKRYQNNHYNSNLHKNNCAKIQLALSNVNFIETAFGNRDHTYKITYKTDKTKTDFETPELFMESINDTISILINEAIKDLTVFKINFIVHADFIQKTKQIKNSFDFQTSNFIIVQGDDLDMFLSTFKSTLSHKVCEFEKKDSGWSLTNIVSIDTNVNKFNPLGGTSYIELPHDIQ